MGLFAVARLAERHGVRVRLRSRSPHGLTALVWLPDRVTEREASLYGARSRMFAAQAGFQARGGPRDAGHARMPGPGGPAREPPALCHRARAPATDPRETVSAAAATSEWFRSRRSAAAQPVVPPDGRGPSSGASGTDRWAVGKHAARIIAEPVRGDLTAAGLPTPAPQANLIPGSAGPRDSCATSRPGTGPEA
jgi:hypothetical protein